MDAAAAELLIHNADRENEDGGGDCSTRTRGLLAEFFDGAFNFRVQIREEDEDQSIKTTSDCCEKVDLLKEERKEEEDCFNNNNKNENFSEKVLSSPSPSSNEKSKKSGSKRPPKPPLPPKGPLLDASDRKLLRELAEIAMRKRERIARLKALKRMRAAKGSSSSSSSKGNISAMIITLIFFLVMIFHGFGSRDNGSDNFEGSPMQAQKNFLSVHHYHSHGFSSPEMGDGGKRERRHVNRKIW